MLNLLNVLVQKKAVNNSTSSWTPDLHLWKEICRSHPKSDSFTSTSGRYERVTKLVEDNVTTNTRNIYKLKAIQVTAEVKAMLAKSFHNLELLLARPTFKTMWCHDYMVNIISTSELSNNFTRNHISSHMYHKVLPYLVTRSCHTLCSLHSWLVSLWNHYIQMKLTEFALSLSNGTIFFYKNVRKWLQLHTAKLIHSNPWSHLLQWFYIIIFVVIIVLYVHRLHYVESCINRDKVLIFALY